MSLQEKLYEIKSNIGESQLLAVSKTKTVEDILNLHKLGQIDFGENKVQELLDKAFALEKESIRWHFIGNLQSNKVNQLLGVPGLVSIHSIGSIKLLNRLLSKKIDKKIGLFLQINSSGEGEKGGFSPSEDFASMIKEIQAHESFYFQGFMTIGRIRTENFEDEAHKSFECLRKLREKYLSYGSIELSMGMSQDYQIALKYGTNWVRVGSKLFGKR